MKCSNNAKKKQQQKTRHYTIYIIKHNIKLKGLFSNIALCNLPFLLKQRNLLKISESHSLMTQGVAFEVNPIF